MRHGGHRIWRQFLNLVADDLNGHYPVMHHKDLPTAIQFPQQGAFHAGVVIFTDVGLHWQPFGRSGINDADVARSGQAHVHGARDGGGGHSQHIHLGAELLELLFVGHAKPLFFVNDHQP